MKEIPFASGSGFYLRELRLEDLQGNWYAWFNDEEVTRYQNKKVFPNSREKQTEYFEFLKKSTSDVVLAIVEGQTHRHVGNVGLHKIDWVHRSAEVGIVIGEKECWGQGMGTEAWHLITKYAIDTLNLNRLYAHIVSENKGSLKCAEASGFKKIGVIEQFLFKDGRYLDACYLNLVAKDFEQFRHRRADLIRSP